MKTLGKKTASPTFFIFLLCVLVCSFATVFWSFREIHALSQMEEKLFSLSSSVLSSQSHRKAKENFLRTHTDGMECSLLTGEEKLSFLQEEKTALYSLRLQPYLFSSESINNRLRELEQNDQGLQFEPVATYESSKLRETVFEQKKSVELNANDLLLLLQKIESPDPAAFKPQTIIKECLLEKTSQNHSFLLKMQLFQREFLKKDFGS